VLCLSTEGGQDDDEAQEIPLPNVKAQTLARVIEFCQHFKTERMNDIEKVRLKTTQSMLAIFCPPLTFQVTNFLTNFFAFTAFEICKYE
jgi:hypothetical protein